MVTDSGLARPIAGPAALSYRWVDELVFIAFLLVAFVGLTPFKNGEPLASEIGLVAPSGAGDSLRQICYLTVFSLVCWRAWLRHGVRILALVPPVLAVLLLWCLASALWSPEPLVTIRRAGLASVLVAIAMLSADALSAERSLNLWRWVLVGVLIVNLVSVKLVPAAVHPAGELDPSLIGNWRGLYGHKNIAGSVAAITVLLFMFRSGRTFWQRGFDWLITALSVVFLIGSHSKSSIGLLIAAIAAGLVYRIAWRRELDRTIALTALGLLLLGGTVTALANEQSISRILEDPTQFTGRTEIWKAEVDYIRDHPVFGSGFGSFAGTGKTSPLAPYMNSWVTGVAHGHNGFLQLLVTVGGVGFCLAMIGLVVLPSIDFWRRGDAAAKALLFALFVFLVLHNLMETDFLEGDGVTWVAFLVMLALLKRSDEVQP